MKVEDFLNEKLVNYASYDNIRSISSCIDGLKNASRKILYTVHEKKIKEKIKVSQLSSKCAEFSDYLHGDVSLQGVIVTLGQDYAGTNNLPLLKKYGNFGTRSSQKSSAPRYIFAKGSDEFFELFKYEDDSILEEQYFEGYKIEPKFYVPTLPMILINGSEGISTGFSQKILPRNISNIKKYLVEKLKSKDSDIKLLDPFINGFNGSIQLNSECSDIRNKWRISGVIEHIKSNVYLIKEIPYQYELTEYIAILDELKDSNKILRYTNESDGNNSLQFKIWMPRDYVYTDKLYETLKLIKNVTENYTSIDENNKIREFTNSKDLIDYYINVKLKYIEKRKLYLIDRYNYDLSVLDNRLRFIKMYIDGKITVHMKSKSDIEEQLKTLDFMKVDDNYNYLINMPLYSLTLEKIQTLNNDISSLKEKVDILKSQSAQDIWLNEIKHFKG